MCKLQFKIIGLWKKKISILKEVMAFIGVMVTLNDLFKMINIELLVNIFNRLIEIIFLLIGGAFFISVYKNCPKNECIYRVKNVKSELFVSICLGDVLNDKGNILIPSNSCFDTSMDNGIISVECVQGQFQKMYYPENTSMLDKSIYEALKDNNSFKNIKRDYPMKSKRYPLGTIAKLNVVNNGSSKRIYLLAVADTNKFCKTENLTVDTYLHMLENFWKQMSIYGHTEGRLAMSVLGVGKAGYPIGVEEAIAYIVSSYISAAKNNSLVGNLAIYIDWNAINHKKIDVRKINKHVEAMCEYETIR